MTDTVTTSNIWIEKLDASDGGITVGVFGDQHIDGGTVRYRNVRIRIWIGDSRVSKSAGHARGLSDLRTSAPVHVGGGWIDNLELSPVQARDLARLLTSAAAYAEAWEEVPGS